MLKLYVRNRMEVEKIPTVLSFKQSKWLEKYISFKTRKRRMVKNDFEKDFYKILKNCFYGKTMETVRYENKVEFIRKYGTNRITKQQSKLTFNGI